MDRPRASSRSELAPLHLSRIHRPRGGRSGPVSLVRRRKWGDGLSSDSRLRTRNMTKDKNILISGASGGVGRGIAASCGEAGWTVWIAARRAEEGASVAEEVDRAGGKGRFLFCDVGNPDSVSEAVSHIVSSESELDGIVHNATSGYSSQVRS